MIDCSRKRNAPFAKHALILAYIGSIWFGEGGRTNSAVDDNQWRSVMTGKISALVAAVLILGSASAASAAARNRHITQPESIDVYAAPVVGSYGGYSADPRTRALERLADKYNGWSEYIR